MRKLLNQVLQTMKHDFRDLSMFMFDPSTSTDITAFERLKRTQDDWDFVFCIILLQGPAPGKVSIEKC